MFIAVCDAGAIGRAAEREGIAPSAISKRIADIEIEIRTPLLIRGQRGVVPTPAGETLLRYARDVVRNLDQLHVELLEHASGEAGHIRILANASAMAERLPTELAAFVRANKLVRIDVEERVSRGVVQGVEDGLAHIGICREFVGTGELTVLPYGHDHFAAIVSEAHPFVGRDSVTFLETLDFNHVGIRTNGSIHDGLMRRIAHVAGREVRFQLHVATFDAGLHFIEAGLVIGIMPMEVVHRYSRMYSVRAIPLSDSWMKRDFIICFKNREQMSPAASRLLEHLLKRP